MMKKYKKILKESENIKFDNNLIFIDGEETIQLQNIFTLFTHKEFKTPVNLYNIMLDNKEYYKEILKKVKEINEDFNEVQKVLYNYSLAKVAELQKVISDYEKV